MLTPEGDENFIDVADIAQPALLSPESSGLAGPNFLPDRFMPDDEPADCLRLGINLAAEMAHSR